MNISNDDDDNTAGQHGPVAPLTLATNALAEILPPLAEMPIPAPLAELPITSWEEQPTVLLNSSKRPLSIRSPE